MTFKQFICTIKGHDSRLISDRGAYREWCCNRCGEHSHTATAETWLSQRNVADCEPSAASKNATGLQELERGK